MHDELLNGRDLALSLFNSCPKLKDIEATPPNWLWPSLVAEGNFHIISGEPGSMKSYITLQIALGIAQGNLFGYEVESRPVLYVDKENPINMVKERATNIGLTNEEKLCYWGLWNENPPPNIEHPAYLALAKGLKPVMIFDSLIRFHNANEDKADEMAAVTKHFRALCAAGATVIVLHHKGKPRFEGPSVPYRGSSEIAGACDVAHTVVKKDDGGTLSMILKAFKNRYEEEKEIKFIFNKERKLFEAVEGPVLQGDEQKVLDVITAAPGKNWKEIMWLTNLSEHRIRAILKEWKDILWVEEPGPMKRIHYFTKKTNLIESTT